MTDLKAGDKIRFTTEAVVDEIDTDGEVYLDCPEGVSLSFYPDDLDESSSFEIIQPPYEVGDLLEGYGTRYLLLAQSRGGGNHFKYLALATSTIHSDGLFLPNEYRVIEKVGALAVSA